MCFFAISKTLIIIENTVGIMLDIDVVQHIRFR